MQTQSITVIDDGRAVDVAARVEDGRIMLTPDVLEESLGWSLKPEGLCRGDVCVPLRSGDDRVSSAGVDLAAFADMIGRPLAVETDAGAAALGASAAERGARLAALEAPDFTLPDLTGALHSLSEHRGKKVLLVAYASW